MEGGPPSFPTGSTCPLVLGNRSHFTHHGFRLQVFHLLWRAVPGPSAIRAHETSLLYEAPKRPHNTPMATRIGLYTIWVWAIALSLAATQAISVDFFCLRLLRCFTSPRLAPLTYVFSKGCRHIPGGGFSHSDISGSKPACDSPELIAACHVLHRRPKPRHPPTALSSLTTENSRRYNAVVKDQTSLPHIRDVGGEGKFTSNLVPA